MSRAFARLIAVALASGVAVLAAFAGTAGAATLNAPVVGIAGTPDGQGYWLAASDGGVFSFGDAGFYGSAANVKLAKPVVGIARTPDGKGYWLVAGDGGVFTYGDAGFYGSEGGKTLNAPIVGIAATPDGKGYWLVGADGGVFTFGDAGFYGSAATVHLAKPVVGIAPTADGKGYWLTAQDGGVFTYGDAGFEGSVATMHLNRPVVGIAGGPGDTGYQLAAGDGGVFSFGSASFKGSLPAQGVAPAPLPKPAAPARPGTVPPSAGGAPDGIPPVYVPIYQDAGAAYGVNWYLIASIHAQESGFSEQGEPSVASGYNCAGAAGPTQFGIGVPASETSCGDAGDSWATYGSSYQLIAGDRPARYPQQSGVTVCLPSGGHPCVYDDFDALAATANYLHILGANDDLGSQGSFDAAEHYNGSGPAAIKYADAVIGRAEQWQAGQSAPAAAKFGDTVFQDGAIKVTQVASAATPAFVVHHHSTKAKARKAFLGFVRAYGFATPNGHYRVRYAKIKQRKHRQHHKQQRQHHKPHRQHHRHRKHRHGPPAA